jgi:hypothetical protein
MSAYTGGSAFPMEEPRRFSVPGMSLRDYFAAKAMAAFIASYPNGGACEMALEISEDAFVFADAMLKAREVQQ